MSSSEAFDPFGADEDEDIVIQESSSFSSHRHSAIVSFEDIDDRNEINATSPSNAAAAAITPIPPSPADRSFATSQSSASEKHAASPDSNRHKFSFYPASSASLELEAPQQNGHSPRRDFPSGPPPPPPPPPPPSSRQNVDSGAMLHEFGTIFPKMTFHDADLEDAFGFSSDSFPAAFDIGVGQEAAHDATFGSHPADAFPGSDAFSGSPASKAEPTFDNSAFFDPRAPSKDRFSSYQTSQAANQGPLTKQQPNFPQQPRPQHAIVPTSSSLTCDSEDLMPPAIQPSRTDGSFVFPDAHYGPEHFDLAIVEQMCVKHDSALKKYSVAVKGDILAQPPSTQEEKGLNSSVTNSVNASNDLGKTISSKNSSSSNNSKNNVTQDLDGWSSWDMAVLDSQGHIDTILSKNYQYALPMPNDNYNDEEDPSISSKNSRNQSIINNNDSFNSNQKKTTAKSVSSFKISIPTHNWEEHGNHHLLTYTCSNALRPAPMLVNTTIKKARNACRVSFQLRINPKNQNPLSNVVIMVAVPEVCGGNSVTVSPITGTNGSSTGKSYEQHNAASWDEMTRILSWSLGELYCGATLEFKAQFSYSSNIDTILDSDGASSQKRDGPKFPVLIRYDSEGSLLSGIHIDLKNMKANMDVKQRFRVYHREV